MKITVKYAVPCFNGYAAQTKVIEGDLYWYLKEGCFYVENRDNDMAYLFSVALMPIVEIVPGVPDDQL